MDIEQYLHHKKKVIDSAIIAFIPKGQKYTNGLHDAVKYSLMSGGKRIRPVLALAVCEAVSGGYKKAVPLAVALEMVHTYTLIHDDLPAMDDDDIRRGKPTCHKAFGEDVAILAGDLLNTAAFQIMAEHYKAKASVLISELASALGICGVVGGQLADLRSVGRKIGLKEMDFINTHKTAYLFIATVRCAAIVGGASSKTIDSLTRYALHMGLAFQIIDDILDHTDNEKNSYPAIIGVKRSAVLAGKELKTALEALPKDNRFFRLRQMAEYLAKRKD